MMSTKDWTKLASPTKKIERMEAFFAQHGFAPHRHDTYALGITLAGVHSFHYRSAIRHSLPGNAVVLHPDELHDGQAGTEEGFHYKILYIKPEIIQQVLGGHSLPFAPDGISTDSRVVSAIAGFLKNLDNALEDLEEDDGIYDIAHALNEVFGKRTHRKKLNYNAAERAREFMLDTSSEVISMGRLEEVAGTDRWSLSRDFRALFGTSPYRYLTLRRLDKAKGMIRSGLPLVDVATACGFSDQSHMTHHFSKAFGVSPRRWTTLMLHGADAKNK